MGRDYFQELYCANNFASQILTFKADPDTKFLKYIQDHNSDTSLNLLLTGRNDLHIVQNTRSCHSADCDTNHSIIISNVALNPHRAYFNIRNQTIYWKSTWQELEIRRRQTFLFPPLQLCLQLPTVYLQRKLRCFIHFLMFFHKDYVMKHII